MTDDKGASEGPYFVTEDQHQYKTVNTPTGNEFELGGDSLAEALNLAYVSGRASRDGLRKALEKVLKAGNLAWAWEESKEALESDGEAK